MNRRKYMNKTLGITLVVIGGVVVVALIFGAGLFFGNPMFSRTITL